MEQNKNTRIANASKTTEERVAAIANAIEQRWEECNGMLSDEAVLDCAESALNEVYDFEPDFEEYEDCHEFIDHEPVNEDIKPQLRAELRERARRIQEKIKAKNGMAKRKLSRVEVVAQVVADMPPIPQDEYWSEEIAEFVAGHEAVLAFTDGMSNSRNDATVEAICQMVEERVR